MITLFIIYLCVASHIKGDDDDGPGDFSFRLETLLDTLDREYSMEGPIKNARAKPQDEMFGTWTQENKSAALIINMFTSPHEITDAPGTTFYSSLNKELRKDNPGDVWQRCEALLNEALNIIGKETFEHLYRGEENWPASFPGVGDTYHIHSFWSTTLDPSITGYFGGKKGFFYHILGAKGVRVQHISVTDDEKEVLIESSNDYIIVRITRDQNQIIKEMKIINEINSSFDWTKYKPKVVITLMEKSSYFKMSPSTSTTTTHNPADSERRTRSSFITNGFESLARYNFIIFPAFILHIVLVNIYKTGL